MRIVFEYILKTDDVGGFVIIVQLFQDAFPKFIDHIYDVDRCQFRVFFSKPGCQIMHQVKVEFDCLVDIRATYFHYDVFAVFQTSGVHLAD